MSVHVCVCTIEPSSYECPCVCALLSLVAMSVHVCVHY